MRAKTKVEAGSGNVFADINLPNAEEHLVKASLVSRVHELIRARKLTQVEAGRILGIGQPDLSKILNGQFQDVSVARLLRFLTELDQDVEIVLKPKRKNAKIGKVSVRAA